MNEEILGLRPALIGDFVASVSDRHFLVANERDDRVHDPSFILPLAGMGGMSGGAVIDMKRRNRPTLLGIIYEASRDSTERFFASHIDFINDDGTIMH